MSKVLEQILDIVLQEINPDTAIEAISQSELPMHKLAEKMTVNASMNDTKKAFTAIIEFLPKSDVLNELSQDMDIDDYLGDWDSTNVIEYVCNSYLSKLIHELIYEHSETLIEHLILDGEIASRVRKELGGTTPKLTIRLHADGSATIKELKIPSENIIKE